MTNYNDDTNLEFRQDEFNEVTNNQPLIVELNEVFRSVPYRKLLQKIKNDKTRAFSPLGRPGYSLEVMLKAYLAGYRMGVKHTNDLIVRLQDNEDLRVICGFDADKPLPHRTTFNRFMNRLMKYQDTIDNCLNEITTKLHELLPGFGEEVAIDLTPVHSHSDPNRKAVSDPEAGWVYKEGKEKKKWEWGYPLHLLVDANHEIPIAKQLTPAADREKKVALPLLKKAQSQLSWFKPKAVIGDPAYDKYEIFESIVKEFGAEPMIKHAHRSPDITGSPAAPICPAGLSLIYRSWDKDKGLQYQCPHRAGRASCIFSGICQLKIVWVRPVHDYRRFGYNITRGSEEWQELYHKRTAIERVNSRLKDKRRLDSHCFRGLEKINLHCTFSVLVMNAMALAKVQAGKYDKVRVSSRQIA